MEKRLVLINPTDSYTPQFTLFNTVPTQLLILATYIKKFNEIDIEILDLSHKYELKNREELIYKYLDKYHNCKFFGISCFSSNYYLDCLYLANKIKEINPNAYLFVGGYHATIKPKDFQIHKSPFDLIFSGEAEIELSNFFKKVKNVSERPKKPKIIYCKPLNKKDFINTDWTYAQSLDFIRNPNPNNLVIFPVFLSRGCPFTCNFCTDPKSNLTTCYKTPRRFPFDKALKEMASINELFYNRKNLIYEIMICDPIFGTPPFRIKLYNDLLKYFPDQYYSAEIRVDTFKVDEEITYLKKLKFSLSFGLESGSPMMLKIMDKTKMPEKYLVKMNEISEKLDKNNIYFITNILLGHPGESYKTLGETKRYLENLVNDKNFLIPQFLKYMLHPGSEIYNNMRKYKKKYGAKFMIKKWWKKEINQLRASQLVNPSYELHCIDLYYEMQDIILNIYKVITNNKIGRRPEMRPIQQKYYWNIMNQISYWKQAPEIFKKFIKDNYPKFLHK